MWKGPQVDGVTQSLLNKFMECPYSFYIYAVLGLKDPDEGNKDNLYWGDSFHKGLELYIPTGDYPAACEGMIEHLHTNYPNAPKTFETSLKKMLRIYRRKPFEGDWITEEVIDEIKHIKAPTSYPDSSLAIRFRGKRDARTNNHPVYGTVLGEHKCKGYIDPLLCKEEIKEDLQCNLYMGLIDDCEWVFYDLIKIPDTQNYGPKQAATEPDETFIDKLYHGPIGSYGGNYPIYSCKSAWISQQPLMILKEEQEQYWDQTIVPTIQRLCLWYDWVTQTGFDHTNPKFFNDLFYKMPIRHFSGRKTEKFKVPYHAYLTGQIGLSDLEPVDSYFSELENL